MADPNKLKLDKQISRKDVLLRVAHAQDAAQADLDRVWVGSSDAGVHSLSLKDDKAEVFSLTGHEGYVMGLVQCGDVLVSGAYDGRLIWWDAANRSQIRTVDAHKRNVRRLTATPDGKRVLSVADDMVCRVWNAATGELVHELKGHAEKTPQHYPSMLFTAAVSPDGRWAATADKVGHVVVWDLENGQKKVEFDAPEHYTWDPVARRHSIGGVRSLAFSPDNTLLALGGIAKIGNIDHLGAKALLHVYEWESSKRLYEQHCDKHNGLVERLTFHPSGEWLLAAGGDNGGFVWFVEPKTGKTIHQDKAPMHIHDVSLVGDLLLASGHGKLCTWTFG